MQNKFNFNPLKYFSYTVLFISLALISNFISGCGGSEEEVTDERAQDSIEVYTGLQKAFSMYHKALTYNEASDDKKAAEAFESALKYLDDVRDEILVQPGNYLWKKDFDELATSVVEDYLTTQSEIRQQSLVFSFAKRIPVKYEKVEEVKGDREPLPDGSDVPLERNSVVDEYIDFFSKTDRGRSFIDKCIYRSGKYFPIMRKILKFNNAPEELIYLSVQESGLNPTIVSRAGAVGLWQFMPATGYAYGLDEDQYRDDRRDFEKSTDAAARHLKDLYKTFDDWYLAFAAYNAGPGRVNGAIRKSGSRDFWSLRGYLPGETKNYVPSIIALSFVLRNPGEYGFNDIEYGSPVTYDRVNVKASMTLQKVADLCETDIETIRELNPEITNDQIPSYDVAYQLRIPHKSFEKFSSNFEKAGDIEKYGSPEFAGNETGYAGEVTMAGYKVSNYDPSDKRKIASKTDMKRVEHEFKKSDALAAVAVFYDVRPVEIRIWNNLAYGTAPKTHQKLEIYISEEKYRSLYGSKDYPERKLTQENNSNESSNVTQTNTPVVTQPVAKNDDSKEIDNSTVTTEKNNDNSGYELYMPTGTEPTSNTSTNKTNEDISDTEEPVAQDNTVDTYVEEKAPVEEKVITETSKKKNTGSVYVVKEGDYLSTIAAENDVTVNQLMEWNDLESDKILVGQKLSMQAPKKNSKASYHVVEEGENLTMIAGEYGMSLSQLKELNDITDDKILVGQKLKVTEVSSPKKNTTKTSGVKKTYKVKKGETLASIAEANDLSVDELMQWNGLESDKILIGQVLKLYPDEVKKKVRKRK